MLQLMKKFHHYCQIKYRFGSLTHLVCRAWGHIGGGDSGYGCGVCMDGSSRNNFCGGCGNGMRACGQNRCYHA